MKKPYLLLPILMLLFSPSHGEGQTMRGTIHVEVSSLKPFHLRVTLRSGANRRVAIDRGQLPWATRYSMILVAVRGDGQCLDKVLPVEDPPVGKISVEPSQVLTGDLNLEGIFKGLDEARKKSAVHLFWAYEAPSKIGGSRWAGGWILIPQDREP